MWKLYAIIFEARSEIHIGYTNLGYIQRTRYYLPGRSMWGAVTSKLTRTLYDAPTWDRYNALGKLVKENFIFSYFFPTFDTPENALLPRLGTLTTYGLGEIQIDSGQFETTFISSPASTSIRPEFSSAEDASLHAMEYLNRLVRYDGKIRRVYFAGYLFARDGEVDSIRGKAADLSVEHQERTVNMRDALSELQVGGERGYGKGRIVLRGWEERSNGDNTLWGKYPAEWREHPRLTIGAKLPIPAHLVANHLGNRQVQGELEPIVGREHDAEAGSGRNLSPQGVFYTPGSIIPVETRLQIDTYGRLKVE